MTRNIVVLRLCLSTLCFGRDKPRSTRPRVPLVKLGRTKVVLLCTGHLFVFKNILALSDLYRIDHLRWTFVSRVYRGGNLSSFRSWRYTPIRPSHLHVQSHSSTPWRTCCEVRVMRCMTYFFCAPLQSARGIIFVEDEAILCRSRRTLPQ